MALLWFSELATANLMRCEAKDGFNHKLTDWSPAEWTNAMAGEVGEACNLTKKLIRGDNPALEKIADELADVVIYADLTAQRLGLNLGDCVRSKFNKKSKEIGCSILLP